MFSELCQQRRGLAATVLIAGLAFAGPAAHAATNWQGTDAANPWWFDPDNWSVGLDHATQDAQINNGFAFAGEGVVFDVNNDPFFTGSAPAVSPFNVQQLYLSHTGGSGATGQNKLTIKSGHLHITDQFLIGRSAPSASPVVVQTGGTVTGASTSREMTLGQGSNSVARYEYRGGTLEWHLTGGTSSNNGIRIADGSGSTGTLAVYNEGPAGRIATENLIISRNGTSTGIIEFHYGNGGTRPIQVMQRYDIRNGANQSSRLHFVLDEAPVVDDSFVPLDLGLFKLNGTIHGTGEDPRRFYSLDGSVLYEHGDLISAEFGGHTYTWMISYEGEINFADALTSQISSIASTGGQDIVLIGHSSTVPEPASLALLGIGGLALLGRRRR